MLFFGNSYMVSRSFFFQYFKETLPPEPAAARSPCWKQSCDDFSHRPPPKPKGNLMVNFESGNWPVANREISVHVNCEAVVGPRESERDSLDCLDSYISVFHLLYFGFLFFFNALLAFCDPPPPHTHTHTHTHNCLLPEVVERFPRRLQVSGWGRIKHSVSFKGHVEDTPRSVITSQAWLIPFFCYFWKQGWNSVCWGSCVQSGGVKR